MSVIKWWNLKDIKNVEWPEHMMQNYGSGLCHLADSHSTNWMLYILWAHINTGYHQQDWVVASNKQLGVYREIWKHLNVLCGDVTGS